MSTIKLKASVRERDGRACTKCGLPNDEHQKRNGRSLDVHRKNPGSPYTPEGCVTLCRKCHGQEPRRAKGVVDAERPNTVFLQLDDETAWRLEELIKRHRIRPKRAAVVAAALLELLDKEGIPRRKPAEQ